MNRCLIVENESKVDVTRSLSDRDAFRLWLRQLLGADRWVEGVYPALAPGSKEEVALLLREYPGPVMVVGSGSNFEPEFLPREGVLVLLTARLGNVIEISSSDQTLTVSAGCLVTEVNQELSGQKFVVPALSRFSSGTIGGRLASVSSRPDDVRADGWVHSLLGVEVVLPNGQLSRFGSKCIKDVAGLDLRHLFTGGRGAPGVIVEAIFRCFPCSLYQQLESAPPPMVAEYVHELAKIFDPTGRMQPGR